MGFPFTKVPFGVACCVFYHHDSAPKFPSYWLNVRDPKGKTFEQVPIGLKDCDYWASWWLNQPIWNIHIRQIGSFPQVRGKNENIWNHHLVTICSYISCALSTTTGQLAIDFRIKINQVFRYCTSDCEEITVGEWVEFHNFYRWKQIMYNNHFRDYLKCSRCSVTHKKKKHLQHNVVMFCWTDRYLLVLELNNMSKYFSVFLSDHKGNKQIGHLNVLLVVAWK